jgi:dihydrofolate reductase
MITLIAAMAKNRVIGKDGKLPWHLPADLAHFKQLTLGHPIIMGRKTFESIGKPLPGRENILITSNENFCDKGCTVILSLDSALNYCTGKDVFVIGGAQIYREMLPYTDCLHITLIDEFFAGNSFFPEIDEKSWRLVSKIKGERSKRNPYNYYFLVYDKI